MKNTGGFTRVLHQPNVVYPNAKVVRTLGACQICSEYAEAIPCNSALLFSLKSMRAALIIC